MIDLKQFKKKCNYRTFNGFNYANYGFIFIIYTITNIFLYCSRNNKRTVSTVLKNCNIFNSFFNFPNNKIAINFTSFITKISNRNGSNFDYYKLRVINYDWN